MANGDDGSAIEERLKVLRAEHRDLDDRIARMSVSDGIDALQLQRLKKRKLLLKDIIARLESGRYPDIIA
jgi:hypothetical protein